MAYQSTCKKCRRLGFKVCDSAKCGMVRKPYPPGQHGKNIRRRLSEYGVQQAEKQKLKLIYGLREKQFRKYFDTASKKSGITPQIMMELLERRLDNVVFRLGLAPTRRASRQLVGHGHITINSKKVSSPSYSVSPGELIDIKESSKAKKTFSETKTILKKFNPPRWLELDKENLSGKVISIPDKEFLAGLPVEVSKVLEYYSR
ncbi:MAG: 30S ribosomal protein S4 [bacterium]|nr:30S ribosomal protein S4 [bacterium]